MTQEKEALLFQLMNCMLDTLESMNNECDNISGYSYSSFANNKAWIEKMRELTYNVFN